MPTSLDCSSPSHTHRIARGATRLLTLQPGEPNIHRSSSLKSIHNIWDLIFPKNHPHLTLLRRRSSTSQFERTATPNASIGFTTASFSITCKFQSFFYLMRSSTQGILFSFPHRLLSELLFIHRQPGSALQTCAARNSII